MKYLFFRHNYAKQILIINCIKIAWVKDLKYKLILLMHQKSAFVLEPLSLSLVCVCVFVSQKKKKLASEHVRVLRVSSIFLIKFNNLHGA